MDNKISQFNNSYRIHYLLNKHGIKTQLFIDSRDILNIILGIKALTINNVFDQKLFEGDNVLIHSLIFEKWLSDFKLLLPHEDEVLYNIIRYEKLINDVVKEEREELFYYLEKIMGIEVSEFMRLEPKDILPKIKGTADNIYKVRYLLNIPNWKKRVKHLWTENIYNREVDHFDYEYFSKSDLYSDLINIGFAELKPKRNQANVNDAMVLCTLNQKLKDFKTNRSNVIPIFYDPSELFNDIIKKSLRIDDFTVTVNSVRFCIIQNHDYFSIQALIKQLENKPLISEENRKSYEECQNLKNKIDINLDESDNIDTKHIKEIKNFIDTKFIKLFWINDKQEKIELISNIKKRLNNIEVRTELETDLSSIRKDIKERVKYYYVFRNTFIALMNAHEIIKKKFTKNLVANYGADSIDLDIFRDYGLTRFSMYSGNCEELQKTVHDLFSLNRKDGFLVDQLSKTGGYLTESYIKPDHPGSQEKLGIGIAVLWILEKYDLIIKILDKYYNNYEYYSLGFFHAATLVKYKHNVKQIKKVLSILNYIEISHGQRYSPYDNYKTAIGTSYIYYHLWEANNHKKFRNTLEEPNKLNSKLSKIDSYLLKAIQFAEIAIRYLQKKNFYMGEEHRRNKYYYIVNNYIYYITMGCSNAQFEVLGDYISILENIKTVDVKNYWQYRFDDTLALYYLRKTVNLQKSQKELKINYLNRANEHISSALLKVLTNDDLEISNVTKSKIAETFAKLKDSEDNSINDA